VASIVALLFVTTLSFNSSPALAGHGRNHSKLAAPHITAQPTSQTVTAGQTATFAVGVSGTTPLYYQWKKNGSPIAGATSPTYSTAAMSASDSGSQFSVAVSNTVGSADSGAATLTVMPATTLLLNASVSTLNFGSVTVPGSSSQNITLTNAGNSAVTISQVLVSGAGFNAGGSAAGLILSPAQSTSFSVLFAPSASGPAIGSVMVSSNATNSPSTIALAGTGVVPVSHSVALSWAPGPTGIVGYNTYVGSASGGPYLRLTSAPLPSTSLVDSSVQSGQTYYYVVTALDATNKESAYSAEVSASLP